MDSFSGHLMTDWLPKTGLYSIYAWSLQSNKTNYYCTH